MVYQKANVHREHAIHMAISIGKIGNMMINYLIF